MIGTGINVMGVADVCNECAAAAKWFASGGRPAEDTALVPCVPALHKKSPAVEWAGV